MVASDGGAFDKVGNAPVQSGSLLSLLPSLLIHGAVVLAIWLGIFAQEPVTPPVTFISLAPAAAPASEPGPPVPSVAAPDLEPEFEPLPLPATGMVLPQPEPPTVAAPEPVLDFAPPEAPEVESFPFDPNATRAPEPAPADAIAIEEKKVAEKPQEPDKPREKPKEKPKAKAKAKPEKPKKKETKQAEKKTAPAPAATTQAAATSQAAATTQGAATTQADAAAKPAAPSMPAPAPTQSAAISNEPVQVTNPAFAGDCPFKYPERARRRNQTGTAVLRFEIGTDGKAFNIVVTESSGHRILDEYAQELISTCKYLPPMRGNRPVPGLATQAVPFTLK